MKQSRLRFLSLIIVLGMVTLQSCQVGRYVWYNFAGIGDYKIFPARLLPKSNAPFRFTETQEKTKIGKLSMGRLDSLAKTNNTVAFLIIRNDSMLFEHYYQNYQAGSTIASFSMAKAYVSALIGNAIADGFIKSVDEPMTNYITELKGKPGFDKIQIKHLLQMTSGIKASESYYNPFGQAARLYYGRSVEKYIGRLETDYPPGTRFAYRSINPQILGLIIERATGKPVTSYLDEKIWKHMGAEFDGSWSLDEKNGLEKTFCCLNAKARDFAKFGRLYLNHGNWNGKQLVPANWVNESTHASNDGGGIRYYKYQWWMGKDSYYAEGILGQFIYIYPQKNLIIVRLGKTEGKVHWPTFFDTLAKDI